MWRNKKKKQTGKTHLRRSLSRPNRVLQLGKHLEIWQIQLQHNSWFRGSHVIGWERCTLTCVTPLYRCLILLFDNSYENMSWSNTWTGPGPVHMDLLSLPAAHLCLCSLGPDHSRVDFGKTVWLNKQMWLCITQKHEAHHNECFWMETWKPKETPPPLLWRHYYIKTQREGLRWL